MHHHSSSCKEKTEMYKYLNQHSYRTHKSREETGFSSGTPLLLLHGTSIPEGLSHRIVES